LRAIDRMDESPELPCSQELFGKEYDHLSPDTTTEVSEGTTGTDATGATGATGTAAGAGGGASTATDLACEAQPAAKPKARTLTILLKFIWKTFHWEAKNYIPHHLERQTSRQTSLSFTSHFKLSIPNWLELGAVACALAAA
jgi:hypothetical protein